MRGQRKKLSRGITLPLFGSCDVTVPTNPRIYHILHVDRLTSVIADGCPWCDAEIARRATPGTTIGMNKIKQRWLKELTLTGHSGLYVDECVPFYFHQGGRILGTLVKYNRKTVTVVTDNGQRWNIPPHLLSAVKEAGIVSPQPLTGKKKKRLR